MKPLLIILLFAMPAFTQGILYGDAGSNTYYTWTCKEKEAIAIKRRVILKSEDEAREKGFIESKICTPSAFADPRGDIILMRKPQKLELIALPRKVPGSAVGGLIESFTELEGDIQSLSGKVFQIKTNGCYSMRLRENRIYELNFGNDVELYIDRDKYKEIFERYWRGSGYCLQALYTFRLQEKINGRGYVIYGEITNFEPVD